MHSGARRSIGISSPWKPLLWGVTSLSFVAVFAVAAMTKAPTYLPVVPEPHVVAAASSHEASDLQESEKSQLIQSETVAPQDAPSSTESGTTPPDGNSGDAEYRKALHDWYWRFATNGKRHGDVIQRHPELGHSSQWVGKFVYGQETWAFREDGTGTITDGWGTGYFVWEANARFWFTRPDPSGGGTYSSLPSFGTWELSPEGNLDVWDVVRDWRGTYSRQ